MKPRMLRYVVTPRAVVVGGLLVAAAGARPVEASVAAPQVRVNRTVPRLEPVPMSPRFSAAPTQVEIRSARVFGEPIVAVGGPPAPGESQALAQAMLSFLDREKGGDDAALRAYLDSHPESAYGASLLLNLGMHRRRHGAYSSAREDLRQAWQLSKNATDPDGIAVADRAIAEFAELNTLFGDLVELDWVFDEVGLRDVGGSAGQKLIVAREGREILRHHHEYAIPSATVALNRLLMNVRGATYTPDARVSALHATESGASLVELRDLASTVGFESQVVFRESGDIPVPSIVHLRVKHYSAVVRQKGDLFLLDDPILGGEVWVDRETLLRESSGYFVVPAGAVPRGSRIASDREAALQRGKCFPCGPDTGGPERDDPEAGEDGDCRGMARWSVYKLHVSLHLRDVPIGYSPPRGPSVAFRLDYNQREVNQPAVFTFSNVGRLWTHDWLTYLEDDPTNPAAPVTLFQAGGGVEVSSGFDVGSGSYERDFESKVQLIRTSESPIRYERRYPDGSIEIFEQADGSTTSPRRVFRTEEVDPLGQKLTFGYDSSLRLVSVVDAVGAVTTIAYELVSDPLKITKVTDPFGRSAELEYDSAGRLHRVTDVIGMASEFDYGSADFVRVLETPYGETEFLGDEVFGFSGTSRRLEVVDPLGARERFEWVFDSAVVLPTEPVAPPEFVTHNIALDRWNSFYWDKRASALFPGDYLKAELTHWLGLPDGSKATAVPASTKNALENRVWYAYPGQSLPDRVGDHASPSRIGRLLHDGGSQVHSFEYNEHGSLTFAVDPVGRARRYLFAENGVDLLEVRQVVPGAAEELLESYSYNGAHLPLAITDAAGQTTTIVYLPDGRLQSIISPARAGLSAAERTTSYLYYPANHSTSPNRLQKIIEPSLGTLEGPAVTFAYDELGREAIVTELPENHSIQTDYDDLDRPTRVSYPDGSFEETIYHRMDAVAQRDRLGRWSYSSYDSAGRLVASTDSQGRTTVRQWCTCGSLESLIDGSQKVTNWEYDLLGRVTKVTGPDGKYWTYAYESATGRLHSTTDPKGQTTEYTFDIDSRLIKISYLDEQIPTPDVTFSYRLGGQPTTGLPEPYGRLSARSDGTGVTQFSYHPVGTLGALRLASVDGPLANDTMNYTYDELGRRVGQAIGSGTPTSWAHDSLGRLASETNSLGTFLYLYEGVSDQVVSVTYPNGQETLYGYGENSDGAPLESIHHLLPSGSSTLSRFDYTFDGVGNLSTWQQTVDGANPIVYSMQYDRANQLTSSRLSTTGGSPQLLKRFLYAYDRAGNRTTEQIDDQALESTYDGANQLTAQAPGGLLEFRGVANEPAAVTVQGTQARVNSDGSFVGGAEVAGGTNTVSVAATDASGNLRTNSYEVSQTGTTRTFSYDDNGNLVSDGERSFEWDAADRLVAVIEGSRRSEFVYNGAGARVAIVEKLGSELLSERRYIWCDTRPCEERDPQGVVQKRYFRHGMQLDGAIYFLVRDHLGSTREITDTSGTVRARYDYDPFGRSSKVSGDINADFGFTGHFAHDASGLNLTAFRAYAPDLGRWMSRDPLGLIAGENLYGYVENRPTSLIDPMGLQAAEPVPVAPAPAPTPASPGLRLVPPPVECPPPTPGPVPSPLALTGGMFVGGFLMATPAGHLDVMDEFPWDHPYWDEYCRKREGRCGECGGKEHMQLQREVKKRCDVKRGCKEGMSAATLHKYIARNIACLFSRREIQRRCYPGGYDTGHARQIELAANAAKDCMDLLETAP